MRTVVSFTVLAVLLLLVSGASAQAPSSISYQGRLLDSGGNPITTQVSVSFSIYSTVSGGVAIWTEAQDITPDAEGLFTAELGLLTPLTPSVLNGSRRFLGITVGGESEMAPRQVLNAVPYAVSAGTAPVTIGPNTITNSMLQTNSVDGAKVSNNSLTATDMSTNIVSSIDGVTNDGGNIDLVAGTGITITPNDGSNNITIAQNQLGLPSELLAYGIVNTDGTLRSGSSNVTTTWNAATLRYEIRLDNVTESIFNQLIFVQVLGTSAPRFFTADSIGGAYVVAIWNSAGVKDQFFFHFMVYDFPGFPKSVPTGDGLATESAQ